MIKTTKLTAMAVLLAIGPMSAQAVPALFDWGFNVDGTTHCDFGPCDFDVGTTGNIAGPGDLPAFIDTSGFDFGTGLGDLRVTISGFGAHTMDLFLDHDIDEAINTFFNEFGATGGGAPAAGQSWEIDEPGFVFGDLFDNFLASTLDNTNGVPQGMEDDVSMAFGWDFALGHSEAAHLDFFVSDVNSAPGFFLQHTDPDSNESIFFWTDLRVVTVSEPATLLLIGIGYMALALTRRRRVVFRSVR